jgi:hypothetical protein
MLHWFPNSHTESQQIWWFRISILCVHCLEFYKIWYGSTWPSGLLPVINSFWMSGKSTAMFYRKWVQMLSHNKINFCQILQECKKISLTEITVQWLMLTSKRKILLGNSLNGDSDMSNNFSPLLSTLAVCCWRWSSISPEVLSDVQGNFCDPQCEGLVYARL